MPEPGAAHPPSFPRCLATYSSSVLAPLAAVAAMYGAFLLIGLVASRRAREGTAAELIVAGRSMPMWVAALTMTATWVDGGYLLGTAEGAFKSSVQLATQGGIGFGLSLILGGVFFAGTMRRFGFTTLIDPLEARFGSRWAAVLFLPALAGELFWSAELLVAIGSTFGVLLDLPLTPAILVSAFVTTAYTVVGGMWSVAYTDVFQLALVAIGLVAALPTVVSGAGGLHHAWDIYATAHPGATSVLPPLAVQPGVWSHGDIVGWWDTSMMLVLGGIPWNCYFQRVLSCRSERDAARQSVWSGVLTMLFTVPPLLMGIAAFAYPWPASIAASLRETPANALPLLFKYAVPRAIGLLGLAAIVGAVTSSFSSSILSAGSMLSWNCLRRLMWPHMAAHQLRRTIRGSVLLFGVIAAALALKVQSVQALWFFTSDLVFVLLFPQLVYALFDRQANRTGSMVAFTVSLALRVSAGEPLLSIPALVHYPDTYPFRTVAALAGLVLLPLVSRLNAHRDPPQALRNPADAEAAS